MKALLISACLLGECCRYDGRSKSLPEEKLQVLREQYTLYPVCPEQDGGLATPRMPSERRGGKVVNRAGADVTEAFERGAEIAVAQARSAGCELALMKERSPSCGSGTIYDGSFSGTLTSGDGVAAERLKAARVRIYGESELEKLLS